MRLWWAQLRWNIARFIYPELNDHWILSPRDSESFMKALDAEPDPEQLERLRRTLQAPDPWSKTLQP